MNRERAMSSCPFHSPTDVTAGPPHSKMATMHSPSLISTPPSALMAARRFSAPGIIKTDASSLITKPYPIVPPHFDLQIFNYPSEIALNLGTGFQPFGRRGSISSYKSESSEKNEQVSELTEAMVMLKLELAQAMTQLDAASQRCHDLERSNSDLQGEAERLREDNIRLFLDAEGAKEKCRNTYKNLSRLRGEVDRSALERTELRVHLERLQRERDEYKEKYKKAEAQKERMRKERDRMERLCVNLRYDRGELVRECRRLSTDQSTNSRITADDEETATTRSVRFDEGELSSDKTDLRGSLASFRGSFARSFRGDSSLASFRDHEDIYRSLRKIVSHRQDSRSSNCTEEEESSSDKKDQQQKIGVGNLWASLTRRRNSSDRECAQNSETSMDYHNSQESGLSMGVSMGEDVEQSESVTFDCILEEQESRRRRRSAKNRRRSYQVKFLENSFESATGHDETIPNRQGEKMKEERGSSCSEGLCLDDEHNSSHQETTVEMEKSEFEPQASLQMFAKPA